jgi:hypothetical protein
MRRLSYLSLVGLFVAAACGAGGVRPYYSPLEEARIDTINAEPGAIIQEIAARVAGENMRAAWQSVEEGFFESQPFNLLNQQSGVRDRGNPDQIIVLRFWADPTGDGRTTLTSEVVVEGTSDQSVLPRDREMMVPAGHGGERILNRVLDGVYERFGR